MKLNQEYGFVMVKIILENVSVELINLIKYAERDSAADHAIGIFVKTVLK
jgi:hypothetical protein